MAAFASRRRRPQEEEESYFISMSDMMVGLLFIFIIMLVYYALQYRQTTDELSGAERTRTEILAQLEKRLKDHGVQVVVDYQTGVLRLPEDVLFAKGQFELAPNGIAAVSVVAHEMMKVLPCYTFGMERDDCPKTPHRIDAIFVEGHTDADPMRGAMDNWDLSVRRATNTYRQLIADAPDLRRLMNRPIGEPDSVPIFGVSGYGPDRPIARGDDEEAKRRNRRIDLRFLMATPRAERDRFRDVLAPRR
jgi:flagellar motor protein MotB